MWQNEELNTRESRLNRLNTHFDAMKKGLSNGGLGGENSSVINGGRR
jgi:hypothetical protein